MYIFDPLGITSNMCATLRLVSRLIVRTSRRMTSTFARLANRFFCTGISHDTYGCVWIERTNVERKKRKENKPKQNTRMHNNERVLTQLLHSDIRYDMSWKKTLAHLRTLVYLLQLFILRATIRYRFISYQVEFREWNHDRLEKCMIQIFSTGYSDEITRFSILLEIKLFDNYIIYIYKFFIKFFSSFLHRSYFG